MSAPRQEVAEAPVKVDWSVPQSCAGCGRPLRPSYVAVGERPGTLRCAARGMCASCYRVWKKAQGIKRLPRPRPRPTVAELRTAGHPCITPVPSPSNRKSSPW